MINILYAGNQKVFDGLLISVLSLTQKTKQDLQIYIMTMDLTCKNPAFTPISDEQIKFIENVAKRYNKNNKVTKVDATKVYKDVLDNSVNENDRCTPYAMLRLLVGYFDMPDKLLYLDTDTIINNDISDMYNTDISNYELAAVTDILFKNFVYDFDYFNSGVMLLNVKKLKETGALDKALKLCRYKKMSFLDQDAINKAVKKRLHLSWKCNWFRNKCKYHSDIIIHHLCNARQKDKIMHRIKPWETELFLQSFPMYKDLIEDFLKCKNEYQKQIKKD